MNSPPPETTTISTSTATDPHPVYLVKGDDPALVAQTAHELITLLAAGAGGADPTLVVEEFGGPGVDDLDVGTVVDACTTPAFLVPRRVIVVRDAGRLSTAEASRLVEYLAAPLPTSVLVLVGGGGTVPPNLTKAAGKTGHVLDTSVGRGKARSEWLSAHLHDAPVRLDGPAAARLGAHLGGDMGRLAGLLQTLAAAYGTGARVSLAELEPFLGAAGSVAPWDLTDAMDAGDTPAALGVLTRLLGSSETHPLVIMGALHRHYRQMLRLDGAAITSPEEAATALGIAIYPAKKALTQSRRLGPSRIGRAVVLLSAADLDLRGATALPGPIVLEVLVARLCRLVRQGR